MKYRDINNLIDEGVITDWNISELECENQNLTSLKGIENFTELTSIYCFDNKLINLSGIENLTNLTHLYCSNNNLTNLNELKKLVKLKYLYCDYNYINDLSGIKDLINLKCLHITSGTKNLDNLNDLVNLTNLEELEIDTDMYNGKYEDCEDEQKILQKIWTEVNLNKDSDFRGKAAALDSGLFDFKTK